MSISDDRLSDRRLKTLADLLCRATQEILAVRYAEVLGDADLVLRSRARAWATYHMPPQRRGARVQTFHVIQFGTRCVESFFDPDRLGRNARDDHEVRTFARMPRYGPLTPAVALSFLVLHEFAHLLVWMDGHRRAGHGAHYQDRLHRMHENNDGVLVAAFLRSEAARAGIDLDAFILQVSETPAFTPGDRVTWLDKGESHYGVILRVNKKSLTIRAENGGWKGYFPPSMIERVVSASEQSPGT